MSRYYDYRNDYKHRSPDEPQTDYRPLGTKRPRDELDFATADEHAALKRKVSALEDQVAEQRSELRRAYEAIQLMSEQLREHSEQLREHSEQVENLQTDVNEIIQPSGVDGVDDDAASDDDDDSSSAADD